MKEKVWVHIPKIYHPYLSKWNSNLSYELKDEGVDIVAYNLNTSSKDYSELITLLQEEDIKFKIFRREYSFSAKEKDQAEILELIIDGDAKDSDSPEPFYFECEKCENRVRKVNRSSVHVDYKHIKKYDISISNPPNSEIFVSERLREVFRNENLTGARFSPIFQLNKQEQQISLFYNLQLEVGIGKVSEPSIIEKELFCERCGFYSKFLKKGLLYFKRKDWKGLDICYTQDTFGSIWANRYTGSKQIIISRRMYQVLRENKFKSFSVRPAYFID